HTTRPPDDQRRCPSLPRRHRSNRACGAVADVRLYPMPFTSPGGTPRFPTREEIRIDETQLAEAIRHGVVSRPDQAFGNYFQGRRASCALGAAYEGMYRLPR